MVGGSGDPFTEDGEVFVWTRDDLDGDDFADAFGGIGAGIDGGFEGGDVAAEEGGDVAGADGFVASHGDVGGFEGSVGSFEERAEAFGFDHSESFLGHGEESRGRGGVGREVESERSGMRRRGGSLDAEVFEEVWMGTGDDVRADEFSYALGGIGAGFDGGFDAADVAFDENGDEAAADLDLFSERDARGFDHGVAGFNGADVAFGFDHTERFIHRE